MDRSVDDVRRPAVTVRGLLAAATAVQDAGLLVGPAPEPELSDERRDRPDGDPPLAEDRSLAGAGLRDR
jgi:hypothetical protein